MRLNIAHFWVARNLDGADVPDLVKNTGNGMRSNFYWVDDTIYSYGRHFPIAQVHEKDGEKFVLFTTQPCSQTTAKHISCVRQALHNRDLKIFYVQDVTSLPFSSFERERFEGEHERAWEAARNALGRAVWALESARGVIREANEMAEFFGWDWRLTEPEDVAAISERARAQDEKRLARERTVDLREQAKRAARLEACKAYAQWYAGPYLEAWRTGAEIAVPPELKTIVSYEARQAAPTALRVSHDGQDVETSLGAAVPLDSARKFWAFVKALRVAGREYRRNGHTEHVGHFTCESVDADGTARIGCHVFTYAEMERFASTQGW